MWMRQYIAQETSTNNVWLGCNFQDEIFEDYTPIIVLRDPVERWISGCPDEAGVLHLINDTKKLDHYFDYIGDMCRDEHHSPQSDFIAGLDRSKAVFFYCDQDLTANVHHYFESMRFATQPPQPINQQSEALRPYGQAWREILKNSKYLEKFQQNFARDYELINSTSFYKAHNVAG
jgi:hypothetical protein